MTSKPYRTHLLERLQTQEDRVSYLRAAKAEDDATFQRAVQDVVDSVNFLGGAWDDAIMVVVAKRDGWESIEENEDWVAAADIIINALKAAVIDVRLESMKPCATSSEEK